MHNFPFNPPPHPTPSLVVIYFTIPLELNTRTMRREFDVIATNSLFPRSATHVSDEVQFHFPIPILVN